MKKFEYKVIQYNFSPNSEEDILNEYGKEGWEMVGVSPIGTTGRIYILKRELKNN